MKTFLTVEQSAELIRKGVPEYKSSQTAPINDGEPIFTLADLFSLLPKEITADTIMCKYDTCPINIRWNEDMRQWFIGYKLVQRPVGVGNDSELIDALFSTLLWAIDNGHVNLESYGED